ncbi:translocation/assembly module TamB domain-containing protein [Blochmannia endosymbiont of Polyrhachis (Hedomyrma) turneri]|uniref:translocation/assembly module TamB domain-containing protein n=1 Tax=Blochmannia endosymbiont of Polyrhachis (Hedomyrma) turneri TaxID=1505596 RepID=UPI00061A841E|nr:translocation/assembly module TamB domain-containing protein [Blochmannia endosymbiont of Polyrhachis (Hedomyrma) turneri]AKC59676.1 Uncharacterized protein ytfN [Blochmannia endosymbiont of Polyrhachis (Hedomyrma) turneri]
MKYLKKIFLIFLTIIFLLFVSVVFFFATDRGVCLMLRTFTDLVPGLSIGDINGNYFSGLTLKNICYQKDGVLIEGAELYVSLDLCHLWDKNVYVSSVFVKNFFISVDVPKFNAVLFEVYENKTIGYIFSLYSVVCRHIILDNVCVKLNDMVITLYKCDTGLIWDKKSLILTSTFFSGLKLFNYSHFIRFSLPNIKECSLKDILCCKSFIFPWFSDLFSVSFFKKKNVKETLSYNLILEGVEGENLFFVDHENFLIERFCLKGMISNDCVRLITLDVMTLNGKIHISGNIKCNEDRLIYLVVDSVFRSSLLMKEEKISFTISGHIGSTLYVYSDFLGYLNGYLILKIELDKIDLPVNFMLNVDSMHSSLFYNTHFLVQNLNLYFDGSIYDYRMNLKLIAFSSDLSCYFNISMSAYGDYNSLVLSNCNVQGLGGIIDITAAVKWKDTVDWNVKLILKNINFSQYNFIRPISVCGEINIDGGISNDILKLKLLNISLCGSVENYYPFIFRCYCVRNRLEEWSILQFVLSIGSNILKLDGDFNDHSSVVGIIKFPSIHDIFPNLNGSIFGTITYFKFPTYSKYLINIVSESFQWKDKHLNVNHIAIKSNLLYRDVLEGSFECQLDDVIYYTFSISKFHCQFVGSIERHNIEIFLYSDLFNIAFNINGSVNCVHNNWIGNILKISIVKNVFFCQLDKRLSIFCRNLPNQLIIFSDDLCRSTFQVNFCGDLGKVGIQKFIQRVQNVHLVIKHSCFVESLSINGQLSFLLDLMWDRNSFVPYGTICLLGDRLEWTNMFFQKKSIVAYEKFVFNIVLNQEWLLCDWVIKTYRHGQCDGKFKIFLYDQYPVFGNLRVDNMSLLFSNMFLEPADIINGTLNVCLRFSGSLLYPEVYGNVELRNLIVKGSHVPFVMTSSNVSLSFTRSRAVLNGAIRTTRGILYLTGNMHWNSFRSFYTHIRIVGNNVQIVLSPVVKVDISPVIIFEMTPLECIIKGTLNIPYGYIELEGDNLKTEVVDVSSDEYVIANSVNYDSYYIQKSENIFFKKIIVHVILHFGDNVKISSFGLHANLRGNLEVIQDQNGLGLKGYISIFQGHFNIYGRSLFIKKGQLLFSGLIDNQPYLNIEAICNSELIKNNSFVGSIRITGCIPAPELQFFSNHMMSQEAVISYLLHSQRIDIVNMNSHSMFRSVLIRFGLFHVEKFVKQIGSILKVNNLVLDTYGFGSESKIVLSGRIAPGLQVKYSIGVFDSLATISARYCVLPDLYLEVVSGSLNQTCSVVYQFKY